MMRCRTASVWALVCLIFVFTVNAQVAGRLSGSVLDSSGAAIPGATISVYVAGGKEPVLTGSSNEAGLFTFPAVRPETYDVVVESAGFAKATLRAVKVSPLQETGLGEIKLSRYGGQHPEQGALQPAAVRDRSGREGDDRPVAAAELHGAGRRAQHQRLPVQRAQTTSTATSSCIAAIIT